MFIKINRLILLGLVFFVFTRPLGACQEDKQLYAELLQKREKRLHVHTLDNGMRVVCYVAENTNQVTVAVDVNVGFKDETDRWGVAHILEHMMFKGTRDHRDGYIDRLASVHGLSRSDYNAYTTLDHTFYFFQTDSNNWKVFGDVVADLLQNLEITEEALSSELSAIAQEIKLHEYDQNALRLSDVYPHNHPYSHAGIGYKEQILSYTVDDVMDFYRKNYVADKATLFVCGKVNPAEVFEYARQTFGASMRRSMDGVVKSDPVLPFYAGFSSTVKTIYHPQLYRQVSYMWQGASDSELYDAIALKYCALVLSKRLQHKWVDEQGMCVSVAARHSSFKYSGIFEVYLQPKEAYYATSFDQLLATEIASLIADGVTAEEFSGVFMGEIQHLVNTLAYPRDFLFDFVEHAGADDIRAHALRASIAQQTITPQMIAHAARVYLRPAVMNTEVRMPLPASEMQGWENLQRAVNFHEAQLLNRRARHNQREYTVDESVISQPQRLEEEPDIEYQQITLTNGISVYFHQDIASENRVFCLLHKDAAQWILTKQASGATGALNYWGDLLLHGNREYTKKELDEYCRARGIILVAGGSRIFCSALKNNFNEALRLLRLSLDAPLLPQDILERKKAEYIESVAHAENNLQYRLHEYLDRTWCKDIPGVFSAAERLAQSNATKMSDLELIINEMRDPRNVVGVFVGNCTQEEAAALLEQHFGTLRGYCQSVVQAYTIPSITHTVSGHVEVASENSLVCAISATCLEDEYDTPALVLLRELLDNTLFSVRQRTGLFYVSQSLVKKGETSHLGFIALSAMATPTNTPEIVTELRGIISNLYNHGLSSEQTAMLKENRVRRQGTYLHTALTLATTAMEALGDSKPFNYNQQFNDLVQQVTPEQMNQVIKKYFDPARWSFITVGRA